MAGARRLRAVFLYARRDNSFRKAFAPYLKSIQLEMLRDIDYFAIEETTDLTLARIATECDLVFLVLSMDLATAYQVRSGEFRRLTRYHVMKRLRILPIYYRQLTLSEKQNPFRNLEWAPGPDTPIESQSWNSPDEAYGRTAEQLRASCKEQQAYVDELENTWQSARGEDDIPAYAKFIETYPHSWVTKDAKRRRDELEEANLWAEAEARHTVAGYFDYLHKAPFNTHRFEAATRIQQLESDPAKDWLEALGQDQLVLYYRHKNRFGGGKHEAEANQRIDEHLGRSREERPAVDLKELQAPQAPTSVGGKTPVRLRPEDAHLPDTHPKLDLAPLDSSFLRIKAYQSLYTRELLAYETFGDHAEKLHQKLDDLEKELRWRVQAHLPTAGAVVLLFLSIVYSYLRVPVRLDYYQAFRTNTDEVANLALMVILTLLCAYFLFIWWRFLDKEIQFVKKARKTMPSLGVIARVSILIFDKDSARTSIEFFRKVEEKADKIFAKWPTDYLMQTRREVEAGFFKKLAQLGIKV